MKHIASSVLAYSLSLSFAFAGFAEEWEKHEKPVPTKITVRVLSHGAKAMSEHTGALVVIREAKGGRELDRGTVEGPTGDDLALMRAGYPRLLGSSGLLKGEKGMLFEDLKAEEKKKEKKWGKPDPYFDLRDERKPEELKAVVYESPMDAARFETVINISKPTQLLIEAYGPLMPLHSMTSTITSVLVFPGEDVVGEGIVMELRGLIVDARDSLREKEIMLSEETNEGTMRDGKIIVPFYMRMLCGCRIYPGGKFGILWEAERFKITTQAYYKGKLYYEDVTTADKQAQEASLFETSVPLPKDLPEGGFGKERVKVRIMAAQNDMNNFGMDEFNVYLSK